MMGIVAALLLLSRPAAPVTMKQPLSATPTSIPSPAPPEESIDIYQGGRIFRVAWLSVPNPSTISLIPNFVENRTARSFIESKECKEVINGGFYTKDNQPTGLFTSEGTTLRGANLNALFNGFFLIDKDNRAIINVSAPKTPLRLGLQTGPILIRNGKILSLAIHDDEFARRVIVGIAEKETIVFLVVYNPENPWNGPKLADTPTILSKVAARLQLRDAINLDGGSASTFVRGDLSLEELTHVGSFFCIQ